MNRDVSSAFDAAMRAFDAHHADDPERELADGVEQPRELLYARRMTEWLQRVAPDASEALQLAARAQHLRRWELPRDRFPMTRQGYHAWRRQQAKNHAELAATVLRDSGFEQPLVERVGQLLRKENLRSDAEVQALEDAVCLVFLQYYFDDFARDYDDDRIITILQRTWGKMSKRGHELALALELSERAADLVGRALAGD